MEGSLTFTEIVGCNGSVLYQTQDKCLEFVCSGRLSVLLAYDGLVLLKLNDFEYGVDPEGQIIYDEKDPQFSIIFCFKKYPSGQYILKINENADSVFSCLNEKCYLKNRALKPPAQPHFQSMPLEQQMEPDPNGSAKDLIANTSRRISKGIAITGKLFSKGFESIGSFISKKVQPDNKVDPPKGQNPQVTKENLKSVANTTKSVLVFTSQQISSLYCFGKKVAVNVGDRFEKSEQGQSLQENRLPSPVKEGTKTGTLAMGSIFDGVISVMHAVGDGISKGASKVMQAKYGPEEVSKPQQLL